MIIENKKIVFLIPTLTCGGAERVVSLMANYWCRNNQIFILTVYDYQPFYLLDKHVDYSSLNVKRESGLFETVFSIFRKISLLRKTLKENNPDCILCFLPQSNIIGIIATRFLNIPTIITERSNPRMDIWDTKFRLLSPLWKIFRALIYRFSEGIVVQTNFAKEYYQKYGLKSYVIPNPLMKDTKGKEFHQREKIIIGVGRLIKVKQFHLLISAYSKIEDTGWKLLILGEGSERNYLEQLICKLKIEDRVTLAGNVKNVDDYLSKASIFVLTSKYEGFPNVLAEAMASGLACISFNCMSGPSDLISNNRNGILVESGNVDELVKSMNFLINNNNELECISNEAYKIIEILSINKIMDSWNNLIIDKVVNGKNLS